MSKIGAGKSPGGSPLNTIVPPRRASPMAWPNACGCTAVTSTPCPPPVAFCTSSTTSEVRALTATSAPRRVARASLESSMSMATTRRPLARAYCTGTWPSPPARACTPGAGPRPADTGDRHPLPGPGVGHLEALVDGDARAQDRRDLQGVGILGDPRRVGGVEQHVGAEAAVDAVAPVLLALAQRFPAGAAVLAGAARRPQPGVTDLVADLQVVDALAERYDGAVALMAGN